jgi:DNA helicase-2/ATP-dependent DNA helicase PcrA
MDSDDSLTVVKRILKEKGYDPKDYSPNSIRNKISSCKNEMISPEGYVKYALTDYDKVVQLVYEEYEHILKTNNTVDFDDLLLLPIKLFREHKEVLRMYEDRFQYVLIDEYQDTNEAQYILTKMITNRNRNICCVGDVDQSIYSFRGANYRNILNFEKDYKEAEIIKLEQNYRSTTNILDAANDVIKNNKERKDKKLWSDKGKGEKISYYRATNGIDEARYVTSEINKLIDNGVEYKDIAVLYRTNAQSRTLEESFITASIPYHIVGGVGFYSRKEIKDVLAYLRLIYNEKDDISLLRVINTPKRGIGNKTIENLIEKSNMEHISLYECIESGKEKTFKDLIEELKKYHETSSLSDLVEKILDLTGIKKEYEDDKTLESDNRLENLEEFKSITKTFEDREGSVSLEDFLYEVSLVTDTRETKGEYDENQVNLLTVHSVKGLEFDYVFIVGLEEGIFPHVNSFLKNSEMEEERRLCYVALTRAKIKLFLINAKQRMLFGHEGANPPSRFISEINDDLLDYVNKEKDKDVDIEKVNIESKYNDMDSVDLKVGDYVYHDVFGQGKVIEISGSLASIAFKHPYGIKKLLKNHKSISKI